MVLGNLRKLGFWFFDFLKGGKVRKHYNEIKFILGKHPSKESQFIINNYLKKLLVHASNTVPFYQKINRPLILNNFPIINKMIINENYESFKSSYYIDKPLTERFTSGSTGIPFKIYIDANKKNRHIADTVFFGKMGGYEIGNPLYFLRIWTGVNKKSPLQLWMQNIKPYSIFKHSETDLSDFLKDLKKDKRSKNILSYASTCEALVNYLDLIQSKSLTYNIKSIITDSDSLSNHTRSRLKKHLQTAVFARYGTMECGILAQQYHSVKNDYKLNTASYYFEVLDLEEDKPAETGELGRIVVTDLFNYSMPLIRYDTGDLCKINSQMLETKTLQRIESIEGRKMDLICNTKGTILSSHSILFPLEEYLEIKQFQFIQKDRKDYLIRLNIWDTFDKEEELIHSCKEYLGKDAKITIEYVSEIPLLNSGKRKLIINEYN